MKKYIVPIKTAASEFGITEIMLWKLIRQKIVRCHTISSKSEIVGVDMNAVLTIFEKNPHLRMSLWDHTFAVN